MTRLSTLLATMFVVGVANAAAPVTVPDTLAQRLVACSACHGKQGEGVRRNGYYPRIVGKPADYLYHQLTNFRDGKRGFPQMVYFVRHLSDAYLREIADYYSGLHPPYPPPAPAASAALMAHGDALVHDGDRTRAIPACVACHGDALTGTLPAIPALVGLFPDYITSQLESWQRGIRHAVAPDCMATIASKLNGQDIAALAAWLAAQPAPSVTSALPPSRELPLDCGSQRATPATAAAPAPSRGEYLARIGDCEGCHTARGGAPFAGGVAMPTSFGTFYTPNITPDRDTGIGRYSADDFWRAMHEGQTPDGALLYPAFPYPSYTRVTRADADAIYHYLRSIPAVRAKRRPHELEFPYSQRPLLRAWRALYFDAGPLAPQQGESAQWNRGAYLVQGLGHCAGCHAARNFLGASIGEQQLRGGMIASADWYAPSLSSDREAGLGQWQVDDIVALLRDGVSPRGAVFGPMALVVHDSLQYLADDDAGAIAVYLKSLSHADDAQAASGSVETSAQLRRSYEAGAKLYDTHCKDCHQADGRGHAPAYPPLAGNPSIAAVSPVNPIRMLLFGGFPPSTKGNPRPYGMPPFAYTLDDRQVADLVTYIRQAWGNRGRAVTPTEVATYRSVPLD